MDTSTSYEAGAAATEPKAAHRNDGRATGSLLLGLWIATAVGLVVGPLLTQYDVVSPELAQSYTVDGWGRVDGLGDGHGPRLGILFCAVAALLIISTVATIRSRGATWPAWMGLLAGTMAVTASGLQLVKLEGVLRNEDVGSTAGMYDVTVGPVAWLLAALGGLAAAAVALSLRQLRPRRREAPAHPEPQAGTVDGRPYLLMALWLVAAIGLAVAPFLTLLQLADPGGGNALQVEGWDRRQRVVGVPCTMLAVGLAVAAVAAALRPAAAWPARLGVLAGTAAAVVAGFHLTIVEPILDTDDSVTEVSLGLGSWLILAAGLLAAAAVGLALVRQRSPEAR